MESPNNGRATIEDDIYGPTITIPAQKNWLFLVFFRLLVIDVDNRNNSYHYKCNFEQSE
jgi:hypothetical protein